MDPGIQIDLFDGSVKVVGVGLVIHRGSSRSSAESMLSEFHKGTVDHGNGYSWSSFRGLTLGGMPCGLALGFHQCGLTQVHLGVALPGVELEGGGPTRESINDEIDFVRKVLREQLGREFGDHPEQFKWGIAWSSFDPKGFLATSGIRYG